MCKDKPVFFVLFCFLLCDCFVFCYVGFLNNMSWIYELEDQPGSAMKLISKALAYHARYLECEALYNVDYFECMLCYNAGLYLQSMQGYSRAIDSFLCCLPVMKSNARLWLRMGQCLLAVWEAPL